MTTRRSILTGAALLAAAAPTAGKAAPGRGRFDIVLFDGRFAESRRFAAVMAKAGATPMDIGEDIAHLWWGPLADLQGKVTICGLTTHSDFFISESIGRERGLKVQYEGRHDARARGPVSHEVGCAAAGTCLAETGRDWAGSLAASLLDECPVRARKAVATASSPRPAKAAQTLFSWVIG